MERAFSISPKVKGRFQWPDERTIRFQPAKALDRATRYEVELGTGAKDADGVSLAEKYRFHFTTVGYLEVTQVIPAPDSQDVEADSAITVMFNRPVVPLTTLEQQEDLPQPVVFDPPIEGRGEWLNTSIYVFTPDGPLAGGTRYTARVQAGLTDTTGGLQHDGVRDVHDSVTELIRPDDAEEQGLLLQPDGVVPHTCRRLVEPDGRAGPLQFQQGDHFQIFCARPVI